MARITVALASDKRNSAVLRYIDQGILHHVSVVPAGMITPEDADNLGVRFGEIIVDEGVSTADALCHGSHSCRLVAAYGRFLCDQYDQPIQLIIR